MCQHWLATSCSFHLEQYTAQTGHGNRGSPSASCPSFIHSVKSYRSVSEKLSKDELSEVSHPPRAVLKSCGYVIFNLQFDAFGKCYEALQVLWWPIHTWGSSVIKLFRIGAPNASLNKSMKVHLSPTLKQPNGDHLIPALIRCLSLSFVPASRTQVQVSMSTNRHQNWWCQTIVIFLN